MPATRPVSGSPRRHLVCVRRHTTTPAHQLGTQCSICMGLSVPLIAWIRCLRRRATVPPACVRQRATPHGGCMPRMRAASPDPPAGAAPLRRHCRHSQNTARMLPHCWSRSGCAAAAAAAAGAQPAIPPARCQFSAVEVAAAGRQKEGKEGGTERPLLARQEFFGKNLGPPVPPPLGGPFLPRRHTVVARRRPAAAAHMCGCVLPRAVCCVTSGVAVQVGG